MYTISTVIKFPIQKLLKKKKIDSLYATKIKQKFNALVTDSSTFDIKRLQGQETPIFRLRVGTYRALFEVHQKTITILVISIDHRKDVYSGL